MMKMMSQVLLVVFAVVTLSACGGEMGKGPSKPAESSSAPALQK